MSRRALSKYLTAGYFVAALLSAGCTRPVATTAPREPDLSGAQDSVQDECLEGDWVMRTADLYLLVATIVPVPNLRIADGSLFLSFTGGQYRYGSDGFVEHIDLGPGRYLEGTAIFLTTGTYASEEGTLPLVIGGAEAPVTGGSALSFLGGGAEKAVTKWLAYKDGRSEEYPGEGPQVSLPLTGRFRYSCSDQELILFMAGMTGEVPLFFKRE